MQSILGFPSLRRQQDFFKLQDGDAGDLGIVSFGSMAFNILLNECTVRSVEQFAVADDVFASRVDIHSVGRLRRRQEINQPRAFGRE